MYAFEPSAPTFSILSNNIKDLQSVQAFQYALSDSQKKLVLKYDFEGSGIASVVDCDFDHYGVYLKNEEVVNGITIDAFCDEHAIDRITLLKLDIEGYEYFALNGAKTMMENNAIDLIQFEMGRPNVDSKTFFKDFYNLLKSHYLMFRILSFGLVPINEYSYEYEVFMGCNYLAVRKNLGIKID